MPNKTLVFFIFGFLIFSSLGLADEGSAVELSKTIPDDPEVAALIERFKNEKKALDKTVSEEKRKQVLMEQHKDDRKMTPEEFIEKMRKLNNEKNNQ